MQQRLSMCVCVECVYVVSVCVQDSMQQRLSVCVYVECVFAYVEFVYVVCVCVYVECVCPGQYAAAVECVCVLGVCDIGKKMISRYFWGFFR